MRSITICHMDLIVTSRAGKNVIPEMLYRPPEMLYRPRVLVYSGYFGIW